MTGNGAAATVGLIALACLVACNADKRYEPAAVVWIGEYLEYAPGEDTRICGGSLAFMDGLTGFLLEEAGGGDGRVRYFQLSQTELEKGLGCDGQAARCANDGWVYTGFAVDRHELVHAAREVSLGFPLPGVRSLEEGLAELYDEENSGFVAEPGMLELLFSAPNDQPSTANYATLGHYFSFLQESYDFENVIEYVNESGGSRSRVDLDAVFLSVFGDDPEQAYEAYLDSYLICNSFSWGRHVYECQQEPRPWDGWVADLTVNDLNCEGSATLGPTPGATEEEIFRYLTFDITDPGFYALSTPEGQDAEGSAAKLTMCGMGCSAPPGVINLELRGAVNDQAWFEPGRYIVRLSRPISSPGFAGFEVLQSPL